MIAALIVDDEEDICEMLSDELKKIEVQVDYAVTGEQAIEKMKTTDYQLGVFDLKLATAITGLDVLKAFRKARPNAKVVAMTGYIDEGLRLETEKMGANDYLVKPEDIQPENFVQRIKKLIG